MIAGASARFGHIRAVKQITAGVFYRLDAEFNLD